MEPTAANPVHQAEPRKRKLWLGVIAALITLLGTYALLEGALVFSGRVWSAATDTQDVWAENLYNANANGWLALYPLAFLSSLAAGLVGARFGPRRSRIMLVALVVLSLVFVVFQSLPPKSSPIVLTLWAACWPLGILTGALLFSRHERQA